MKKIIFFDGDGTLWYPKATKHKKAPQWIYQNRKTSKNPEKHLILIPTVLSTLKKLISMGIILVILSTHPHPPRKAGDLIKDKVKHFQLKGLFSEVHATREYHGSKGEFMVNILKRRGFHKKHALMVGDQYNWDYKPAKENGIDALLIESEYMKLNPNSKKVRRTIKRLKDIFNYL
jgi:FMN phosphatase YigB (HAD superfamily)